MASRKYGRLFVPIEQAKPETDAEAEAEEGGPAAVPIHSPPPADAPDIKATSTSFRFKPDIGPLVKPDAASLEPGTDIWAIHHGIVSITPLSAAFEAASPHLAIETEGAKGQGLWKL